MKAPRRRAFLRPAIGCAVALFLAAACDDFVTYRVWDGAPQIAPQTASIETEQTIVLEATGGRPPYQFSIVSGEGTLAAEGAQVEYTAPAATGLAVIQVTDDLDGRDEARITIVAPPPPLAISPAHADVWLGGRVRFRAAGGVPPYRFSVVAGGGSIDASSGEYKAPIRRTDATVQVSDQRGSASRATVSVHILPFF